MRSCIPMRPLDRGAFRTASGSKPRPPVFYLNFRMFPSVQRLTATLARLAWRAALVNASCTTRYAPVSTSDAKRLSTPWCLKFTRTPVWAV